MKTTFKVMLAAAALSAFALESCKKGDGDPFLSLHSRKARVAGDWVVSKTEATSTSVSPTITYTQSLSYDGTTGVTVSNPGNQTSTETYSETYSFDKKGTYTYVRTSNGSATQNCSTAGTWNFTGGVGDEKNKSQLVLTLTSYTDSGGSTTFSGSGALSQVYDIYELKNKEMIWKSASSQTSPTSSSNSTITLTAK